MCKLLPKVIMTVQRTTTVGGLQCDISKWHQLRLDGSSTRLCTSLAEDKNIPYSDKALANTKEEQLGYGPKSEFKCINSDSSTDNSDNDVFFYEAEIRAIDMEEREAQIQTEILANTEGELYRYNPKIKYEPLKRYDVPRFVFSEDSSTDCSDIESEAKMKPWFVCLSIAILFYASSLFRRLSYFFSVLSITIYSTYLKFYMYAEI